MVARSHVTRSRQKSALGDLLRHTREQHGLSQWALSPDDAASHFDRSVAALGRMLAMHDPAPAVAFDADWRAFRLNRGGRWLCSVIMPGSWAGGRPDGVGLDMLAAAAHPDGLLSHAAAPRAAGAAILAQVRAEAWTNPRLTARADAFEPAFGARFGALEAEAREPSDPQLQHVFRTPLGALRFYTIQTVFGLPQDVTASSLRAELWFPSDAATRDVLQRHVPARAE